MTNYSDIPTSSFVCQNVEQYTFKDERPKNIDGILKRIIIDLIKQSGFNYYEIECVTILERCLNDFYRDLIERFKQHLEIADSSRCFQVIRDYLRRNGDDFVFKGCIRTNIERCFVNNSS